MSFPWTDILLAGGVEVGKGLGPASPGVNHPRHTEAWGEATPAQYHPRVGCWLQPGLCPRGGG